LRNFALLCAVHREPCQHKLPRSGLEGVRGCTSTCRRYTSKCPAWRDVQRLRKAWRPISRGTSLGCWPDQWRLRFPTNNPRRGPRQTLPRQSGILHSWPLGGAVLFDNPTPRRASLCVEKSPALSGTAWLKLDDSVHLARIPARLPASCLCPSTAAAGFPARRITTTGSSICRPSPPVLAR
jgi:hypothetical protein